MAFDKLVSSYEPELRRFLSRKVSESDVEDVLQDTWVAAWTALNNFDGRSRFKTWLYALSLNKCRDHHRALKRLEPFAEETAVEPIAEGNLEKETENREAAAMLLDALTPSQREVIELYYFAEFTLPEIARALNRNLNTVKYQFYRAHVQASLFLEEAGLAPREVQPCA